MFHMMPQCHRREGPWWAELVLIMGGSKWCQPYVVVHGIGGWLLVCGLGGLCERQGWAAIMMCN